MSSPLKSMVKGAAFDSSGAMVLTITEISPAQYSMTVERCHGSSRQIQAVTHAAIGQSRKFMGSNLPGGGYPFLKVSKIMFE
jgi:hypothetical protein